MGKKLDLKMGLKGKRDGGMKEKGESSGNDYKREYILDLLAG